jgi:prepilin-type N-terminal cleavage/methylation domain-containing protein
MHKIRKTQTQSGFSMVEVLVSLALVSMLISVIYVIVINSTSLNARTTLRAEAGSLAFKKIQDYINLGYDNIPIG